MVCTVIQIQIASAIFLTRNQIAILFFILVFDYFSIRNIR